VTGDNTALQGFDAIVKAARDAKLPLIINDPEFVQRGALIAVGIGWYETGKAASKVLARVLRGEQPRNIPFEEVAVKKLVLNQEVAKTLGITFRRTWCRRPSSRSVGSHEASLARPPRRGHRCLDSERVQVCGCRICGRVSARSGRPTPDAVGTGPRVASLHADSLARARDYARGHGPTCIRILAKLARLARRPGLRILGRRVGRAWFAGGWCRGARVLSDPLARRAPAAPTAHVRGRGGCYQRDVRAAFARIGNCRLDSIGTGLLFRGLQQTTVRGYEIFVNESMLPVDAIVRTAKQ
jgi:hypothetical protein